MFKLIISFVVFNLFQCDQIWIFLKDLCCKRSKVQTCKSAQIFGDFLDHVKKYTFKVKPSLDTYWATF